MNDNLSMKQVIDSVNKGMNKASKDYSFPYGIILCSMRHLPLSKSVEVIRAANAYKNNENIVAVDLAGDEFNFSPDIFKNSFRQSQLPITIHAGEALGAESVLSAINMGANRIGHGIRSIEDDNVINLLLEKNIALEVCPKSNKQTNVYENFSDYPIKQLFDKGLSITLNSDNLTVSNTSFEEEVNILKNNFGFNNQNIKSMLLNSACSIFNSDNLKSDLSSKIESDFKLKKSSKNKP